MDRRYEPSGVLLVLLAGTLWATVGPAQVLAAAPATPAALGGARILLGGVVLAAFVLVVDRRAFRALARPAWPALLTAAVATAVFQVAFLTAVATTGAAVATAVTFGVVPVATGVCERLVLRTRLSRSWIAGTACAVVGCGLVVIPAGEMRVDVLGAGCAVVAAGCFGVYTVAAKRLVQRGVTMPAAASVTLLLGGAALTPWILADLPGLTSPRSLALVAWLGPVTAALAYWLFVTGLRRVSAATAGTLSLAEPLVAAALAVGVLGERLPLPAAVGAVVLLGGLAVVAVMPARGSRSGRAIARPRPEPAVIP